MPEDIKGLTPDDMRRLRMGSPIMTPAERDALWEVEVHETGVGNLYARLPNGWTAHAMRPFYGLSLDNRIVEVWQLILISPDGGSYDRCVRPYEADVPQEEGVLLWIAWRMTEAVGPDDVARWYGRCGSMKGTPAQWRARRAWYAALLRRREARLLRLRATRAQDFARVVAAYAPERARRRAAYSALREALRPAAPDGCEVHPQDCDARGRTPYPTTDALGYGVGAAIGLSADGRQVYLFRYRNEPAPGGPRGDEWVVTRFPLTPARRAALAPFLHCEAA